MKEMLWEGYDIDKKGGIGNHFPGLPGYANQPTLPPTNCPSDWKAPKNRDQLRKILHSMLFHPLINTTPNIRFFFVVKIWNGTAYIICCTIPNFVNLWPNFLNSAENSPTIKTHVQWQRASPFLTFVQSDLNFDCIQSFSRNKGLNGMMATHAIAWRPSSVRRLCRKKVNND